ncbi:MAG TPA: extracellular solute-binding protein [Caldilineaceae bacterium]|nr:extracellular solute-binding protein [Caldilineaceae bacterium]
MHQPMLPTPTRFSRRAFLRLAGGSALVASALVAACAPAAVQSPAGQESGASSAPAAATAKLTVMAFGQADQPAFQALAEAYVERNPDADVEAIFLPNDESYYATLQTQYAGGSNPSIASMQGWGYQIFAENSALAGLNALRERDDYNDAWADVQVVRDYTERNGDTYLVPMQLATMVMFYAKKPFDESGIPYPTDDWTYAEFLDIAQKLTKTDGDLKQWGYQANGNWFRDIHWIRGTGAQEFDALIDPKTAQFTQEPIVNIVQQIASDFYHTLKISPLPADLSAGSGGIEAGQSAMKYEGPWWFPQMVTPEKREQNAAVDFDVVLMPKQEDENRPHRGWAEGVVIFANAPVDAAWDLVKFMSGADGQKIFSEITGRIPNSFDLVESFWAPKVQENHGLTNTQAFLTAFSKGEVDIISGLPRSQYWNEVVKPTGWDPLMAGSASAADVLPQVDAGVQALLDEYNSSKG